MRNIYEWIDAINSYLGIPKGLLLMIAYQENGRTWSFNTSAVNRNSGAKGAMQLTDITRKQIHKISGFMPNPFNLIESIYGAGIYLKWLYAYFGNWRHAIAAYNAGFGTVRNNIRKYGYLNEAALSKETQNYMYVANHLGV